MIVAKPIIFTSASSMVGKKNGLHYVTHITLTDLEDGSKGTWAQMLLYWKKIINKIRNDFSQWKHPQWFWTKKSCKFYEPHIIGDFVMHTWIYYCIDGCLHYDDLMWTSQW